MEATITALQTDVLGFVASAVAFSVAVGTAIIGYTFVLTLIRKARTASRGHVA